MKRAECSGRNIGKVFSPFSSWSRRTLYRSCNSQLRGPRFTIHFSFCPSASGGDHPANLHGGELPTSANHQAPPLCSGHQSYCHHCLCRILLLCTGAPLPHSGCEHSHLRESPAEHARLKCACIEYSGTSL